MFIEVDFTALQQAAQAAQERGADPALQSFERLRDEAMQRKIRQADMVDHMRANSIDQENVIYLALDDGLMEGFYLVDFASRLAWRWENEDEGEVPCLMSVPRKTASGLPKICGTCRHNRGPGYIGVSCAVHPHDGELTIYYTCRTWALREDMNV